jgi:hypothetical protein
MQVTAPVPYSGVWTDPDTTPYQHTEPPAHCPTATMGDSRGRVPLREWIRGPINFNFGPESLE